jgi:uncharacterized integral membrane protein
MSDESHEQFDERGEPAPRAGAERPEIERPTATGIAWGAILLLLGIALVVIFSVQNTDAVPVRFLWMEGEFSLAVVVLVTVGVIIVLTESIGLSYRRRRRRRIAERQELKKYRGARPE